MSNYAEPISTDTHGTVLQLHSGRYNLEIDDEIYSLVGFWLKSSESEEYLYKVQPESKQVILHHPQIVE